MFNQATQLLKKLVLHTHHCDHLLRNELCTHAVFSSETRNTVGIYVPLRIWQVILISRPRISKQDVFNQAACGLIPNLSASDDTASGMPSFRPPRVGSQPRYFLALLAKLFELRAYVDLTSLPSFVKSSTVTASTLGSAMKPCLTSSSATPLEFGRSASRLVSFSPEIQPSGVSE